MREGNCKWDYGSSFGKRLELHKFLDTDQNIFDLCTLHFDRTQHYEHILVGRREEFRQNFSDKSIPRVRLLLDKCCRIRKAMACMDYQEAELQHLKESFKDKGNSGSKCFEKQIFSAILKDLIFLKC